MSPSALCKDCLSFCLLCAVMTLGMTHALETDIHQLVRIGDLEPVREALTDRPDLVHSTDSDRRTPLHIACRTDNLAMVDLLLAHGAEVDVQDAYLNSPLHYLAHPDLAAAADGEPSDMRALRRAGKDGDNE